MTLEEFKSYLPQSKKDGASTVERYLFRPVSIPVSWVLHRMGVTANQVTLLGLLLAFPAAFLIATGDRVLALIGAVVFVLVALLDCVDGNIARANGLKSLFGPWFDAVGGYFCYMLMPLALGLYVEQTTPVYFFSGEFILLGGLASNLSLLMRLVHQKAARILPKPDTAQPDGPKRGGVLRRMRSSLPREFNQLTLAPLFLGAILFNVQMPFLVVFTAVAALTAAAVMLHYGMRVSREDARRLSL
ncbi:MAG: CDP-alcohol phosphatidyltransferase family protein [Rhodobacteraceae bacterium]|nr:CDP-alcohol phosphatidyltransferase family protein [Paracoccaceae bacterium]